MTKKLEDALGHLRQGRIADAERLVKEALRADPESPAAHHLAGLVSLSRGRTDQALGHFEKAVAGAPDNADFRLNMGVALDNLGHSADAAVQYRQVLTLDPGSVTAQANLGFALRSQGQYAEALAAFTKALAIDPGHVGAGLGLVSVLEGLRSEVYNADIEAALAQAFASPHGNHADLALATAHQLGLKFGLADQDAGIEAAEAMAEDALFGEFLTKCVNTDPAMEIFLTGLRRALLFGAGGLKEKALKAAALLGVQCFFNEYVWQDEDDETKAVQGLRRSLEDGGATIESILLYGLYGRLGDIDGIAAPPNATPDLGRLFRLTLEDSLTEQALKERIETLQPITDKTSKAVGAQYEANPYPRWLHAPAQQPASVSAMVGRLFPHFTPPTFPEAPNILIAGCGTGQHVVHVARSHPGARILAIDLSKSSIAYAMRMCDELGVEGVNFLQADILDAGGIDDTFEMIQSVGVLHHMKDPVAGWRQLTDLLAPGGVFKVGLYSDLGRQSIQACREIIADTTSVAEIKAFRQRLMEGQLEGDFSDILETADFYSTSMCRDLLFHVQEHHWTPARIKKDLADLGLDFIGFEGFDDTGINAAYRETFPEDAALTGLDNWQAFEDTHGSLTDMYVFWCQKPAE